MSFLREIALRFVKRFWDCGYTVSVSFLVLDFANVICHKLCSSFSFDSQVLCHITYYYSHSPQSITSFSCKNSFSAASSGLAPSCHRLLQLRNSNMLGLSPANPVEQNMLKLQLHQALCAAFFSSNIPLIRVLLSHGAGLSAELSRSAFMFFLQALFAQLTFGHMLLGEGRRLLWK